MLGPALEDSEAAGEHARCPGQEDVAYPVGYAEGDGLLRRYGLRGMPTTLFFDAFGRQVGRVAGYLPEAQLRDRKASR